MRFFISSKKRITDEMSSALAALQDLCATVGTSTDLQLTNDDGSKEYTSIVCHYQVSILTSTDLQLTNDDGWYEDTSICGQWSHKVSYGYFYACNYFKCK